jgi:hypothetical protein
MSAEALEMGGAKEEALIYRQKALVLKEKNTN